MEIKISDDAGIRTQLDREFDSPANPAPYNLLSAYIKENFRDAFALITDLIPGIDPSFYIRLESDRTAYGQLEVMASVDVEKSSQGHYYFDLHYSTLRQLMSAILQPEKEESDLIRARFFNTVLHELIHCADMQALRELTKTSLMTMPVRRHFMHNLMNLQKEEEGISLNLAFVYFLAAYRNEGVAILGEKLLGLQVKTEHNFPAEERHNLFYQCFHNIIRHCSGLKFYNRMQNMKFMKLVEEFSGHAYMYGDLFLLDLLRLRQPELEELIHRASSEIYHMHGVCCSREEKIFLLKKVFETDISDFMQMVLLYIRQHPDAGETVVADLLHCCAVWQEDSNPAAISSFAKSVAHAAHVRDEKAFLHTMKQSVGSLMPAEDIRQELNRFLLLEQEEDIVHELKLLARILHERYTRDANPIAAHALTYLLDNEDLVFDQIPLLGWQDDWMVLEAALLLLNQKVPSQT
jgi:hypothetical protein